jgi:hypothetical protein
MQVDTDIIQYIYKIVFAGLVSSVGYKSEESHIGSSLLFCASIKDSPSKLFLTCHVLLYTILLCVMH